MKKGGEWSYMNLDYFTLLSYEPVHLQHVGSVKSPLLKDLAGISLPVYHFYLSILMMDVLSSLNFFLSDDIEYIESERQFATYNSVVDKKCLSKSKNNKDVL